MNAIFFSGKKQFYHQSLLQAFHKISRCGKDEKSVTNVFYFSSDQNKKKIQVK